VPVFLPDILPLDRAAFHADVKAGKAIFHLGGKGKAADLQLPAVAEWKHNAKKDQPLRPRPERMEFRRDGTVFQGVGPLLLLIVQAEIGRDGGVVYGVIMREGIRTASARELTNIKTFVQLEKEEKEAKQREKDREH
jgi:hypothetical protein